MKSSTNKKKIEKLIVLILFFEHFYLQFCRYIYSFNFTEEEHLYFRKSYQFNLKLVLITALQRVFLQRKIFDTQIIYIKF